MATGKLQIQVTSQLRAAPVEDAVIDISSTGEPDQILEEVTTDSVGQTDTLELEAPPEEYSLSPGEMQPYSEYNFRITAPGYEPLTISGAEILANQLALQDIRLKPLAGPEAYDNVVIPAHTLYGNYPPKIAEAEIKPLSQSGEIVLSRVVIPEFIVVHDGAPTDSTAGDYYVRYRDYIKNVASSEIYATWPKAAIRANVLAIMSFTLNRVYTEWYRNKGFDFTITSSTAFDRLFIPPERQTADPDAVLRRQTGQLSELDVTVGFKVSGRSGIHSHRNPPLLLWRQHLYQFSGGDFRDSFFLAWIRSRHRGNRAESGADAGTVKCDFK